MNTDAKALSYLYSDSSVLVPRQQNGVRYRMVTGQVDEICDDERIDALLLTVGSDDSEAQLYVVRIRDSSVLRR